MDLKINRHVADKLAGRRADQKRIPLEQRGKERAHALDTAHIARKDKEEYERKQKTVINLPERFAVEDQKRDRDHDQPDPVRNPSENDHD